MENYIQPKLHITGLGVVSAIGQGKDAFITSLIEGRHAFRIMEREGRQKKTTFLGAEISSLPLPDYVSGRMERTLSLSGKAALSVLEEAWNDAELDSISPDRIGLVIGGSNFQQRELIKNYITYSDNIDFIRPTYGVTFMDSDLCGVCTEHFDIRGFAYTLGGASASGQMAIIQAINSVVTGQVDVCIALGALMDLSYLELQAFHSLGAMVSNEAAFEPGSACRPFDEQHNGFIFGENCGAIVIERADRVHNREVQSYGEILGGTMTMDGNRNPNPSYEGEVQVIKKVLEQSKLSPHQIDYINPHGTGSRIGDKTEIKAIMDCGLSHAYINTTKSIIGHGLSSAGVVEVIATLLQIKERRLHPSRNLVKPIETSNNWVREGSIHHAIQHALTLSMGFGGINTAICLKR